MFTCIRFDSERKRQSSLWIIPIFRQVAWALYSNFRSVYGQPLLFFPFSWCLSLRPRVINRYGRVCTTTKVNEFSASRSIEKVRPSACGSCCSFWAFTRVFETHYECLDLIFLRSLTPLPFIFSKSMDLNFSLRSIKTRLKSEELTSLTVFCSFLPFLRKIYSTQLTTIFPSFSYFKRVLCRLCLYS